MPAPVTNDEFVDLVRRSAVVDVDRLEQYLSQLNASGAPPADPRKLSAQMVRDGVLTLFQAEQFLQGKWKRFNIGKYKVLERLGSGGMGQVYLCEHKLMRRRVAVKVLPTVKADDPASRERFYREARAIAALDHPNLVRAFDIDQDDTLHYIVMEYIDGASLQEIVRKSGPLDVVRACHYIHDAAVGLEYAFEVANLLHRDVKPGNILVDRTGQIKLLDMGLARFFNDDTDILTRKYDESTLGTADYLSPEQAVDSHSVDIRADIYGLGATFYFILAGQPPFPDGTVAQKLVWHQTKQPKPLAQIRPDLPASVVAIVEKMMRKNPAERFATPSEVAEALQPMVTEPIPPPTDIEMPQLSLAALAGAASSPARGKVPSSAASMKLHGKSLAKTGSSTAVVSADSDRALAKSEHSDGGSVAVANGSGATRLTDSNPFSQLIGASSSRNGQHSQFPSVYTPTSMPKPDPSVTAMRKAALWLGVTFCVAIVIGMWAVRRTPNARSHAPATHESTINVPIN